MKFVKIIQIIVLIFCGGLDGTISDNSVSLAYWCSLETDEFFHFNSTMNVTKCVFYGIKRYWWQSEYELVSPIPAEDTKIIDMGGSKFNNRSLLDILTGKLCETFKFLEFFAADYLELDSIQPGAFDSCMRLKFLDLDGNNLIYLPQDLFRWNFDLRKVSLTGNNLTMIDFNIFSRCSSLEYLNLINNQLIEIGSMPSLPNLRELNLANNFLRDVDFKRMMTNFTALENVRLCKNRLSIWLQKKIRNVCRVKEIATDLEFCVPQMLPKSNLGNWIRVIHEIFG